MRKALRINIVPHFSVDLSSTCSYIFLISRRAEITYTKSQFQVFYNHLCNFKTSKLQFHVFIRRDVYPVTLCFSSSHITYLVSATSETFVTLLLSMVIRTECDMNDDDGCEDKTAHSACANAGLMLGWCCERQH